MIIEASADAGTKTRWKLVRRDDFRDIDGQIVHADEQTGECSVSVNGETKNYSLGEGGLRITRRAR